MPCSDGYGYNTSVDHASIARADKNARVACNALKVLQDAMGVNFTQRTVTPETWAWWNAHQEADRIRERREAEAREREALRDSAISKMTPEERRAMGL